MTERFRDVLVTRVVCHERKHVRDGENVRFAKQYRRECFTTLTYLAFVVGADVTDGEQSVVADHAAVPANADPR